MTTTTKRAPHLDQGPEAWEQNLFDLWDRAISIRKRYGLAVAEELTRRALATITIVGRTPPPPHRDIETHIE
jgi:hypothetical protein